LNQQFRHRQFPAGNPLANVLVVIVGMVVISLSLALGLVVFVGIAGFLLVMGLVMRVRNWWLARGIRARTGSDQSGRPASPPGQRHIIEGEYQEVGKSTDSHDRS
jgi:hypothetical protein